MGWGGGGVDNVCLDIHLHDDLFLLIASTVPCNTDSLRLIDVVGLGWWGGGVGWVGGVLITSLWIFIYVMISFCKSLPQYHVTQMLCILHSFTHSLTHSVTHSLIHSFIHSFIHTYSKSTHIYKDAGVLLVVTVASNLLAMASIVVAMASNLLAMTHVPKRSHSCVSKRSFFCVPKRLRHHPHQMVAQSLRNAEKRSLRNKP